MIGEKRCKAGNGFGRVPVRILFILTLAFALLAVFLARRTIFGNCGEMSPELAWSEVDPLGLFEDLA